MKENSGHVPVLGAGRSPSIFDTLEPVRGDTVLDATAGLGGHAAQFLRLIGPEGRLIGIDADRDNLERAGKALSDWTGQTRLLHGNFGDIAEMGVPPVDVLFADLGLSSPHVDDPERGFSFRREGPLDLRFDRARGESASAFLGRAAEREIAAVLRDLGEMRDARRIARAIIRQRERQQSNEQGRDAFPTTSALRAVIEEAVGWRAPSLLPQVFQALRMHVNHELQSLAALLEAIPRMLKPGGRAGIICYHSLEDRLVKQSFRTLTTPEKDARTGSIAREAPFRLLTKRPVRPGKEEVAQNPRSRSALFRAIIRA